MNKKKDEQDIPIGQDLAHVFPLPVRVMPEPWEDLASLLSRAAVEMGYTKVHWLLRPEDVAYRRLPKAVCLLSKEADYRFLERLLQLEEEELYRLTFHRFCGGIQAPFGSRAPLYGEIRRPLLQQISLRYFLSMRGTRVCPQCLADGPAHGQGRDHRGRGGTAGVPSRQRRAGEGQGGRPAQERLMTRSEHA